MRRLSWITKDGLILLQGPCKREAEGQSQRRNAADLKIEEGGHELLEVGKCKETNSTLEFPERKTVMLTP